MLYVISRIIKCHKTLKALANRETLLLQRRFYSLCPGQVILLLLMPLGQYILTRKIVSLLKKDSGTGTLVRIVGQGPIKADYAVVDDD